MKNNKANLKSDKSTWINQETGETVEARISLNRVARENFEIVYLSYFLNLFDELGGKKYQVLKYIMANRSYDNTLMTTTRELALNLKISTKTVTEALKVLKRLGIIKTRIGGIILNAKFMNRGSARKEAYIMQKFEIFDSQNTDQDKQLEQTNLLDHC